MLAQGAPCAKVAAAAGASGQPGGAAGHAFSQRANYKGGGWRSGRCHFKIHLLGKRVPLGIYAPDSAVNGARLYDALHLLLYGHRADTNFAWCSYTQADIAAAIAAMKSQGVDVPRAVAYARSPKASSSKYLGVSAGIALWQVNVHCHLGKGQPKLKVCWGRLCGEEVAAHFADCGMLAINGLQCTTNFPASRYSQEQLEEVAQQAISKGVNAECVRANLAAVAQVGRACCAELQSVGSVSVTCLN